MKLVPAVSDRAKDGTYSVYCENECFSGMGNTLEAAKADMKEQRSYPYTCRLFWAAGR